MRYPEFANITREIFFDTYDMVVSRCFGWSLPGTMMIPYADLANHHNSDTQYEMFNPRYHFSQDKDDPKLKLYQTRCKMMLDFSDWDESRKDELKKF